MMIVYIALFGWWFSCLSSIPQRLMMAFDFMLDNLLVRNLLRLLSCEKCLSFWIALFYFAYETRHIGYTVLFAGITSLVAIVLSRIYYKLLS